jgi:hypothetical protein
VDDAENRTHHVNETIMPVRHAGCQKQSDDRSQTLLFRPVQKVRFKIALILKRALMFSETLLH